MKRGPLVDIIYNVYIGSGDRAHILQFLASINAFRNLDGNHINKIYVVDNASPEDVSRLVGDRGDIVYTKFTEHKGAAAGRNSGWRRAAADRVDDYFIWIDTDVVPQKQFFIPSLAHALIDDIAITVPLTNFTSIEAQKADGPNIQKQNTIVQMAPSLCYCMRYSTVEEFMSWEKSNRPNEPEPGLFDPKFFPVMYEDSDYCYRITNRWNKKIQVVGSTFALHFGGSSISSIEDKQEFVRLVEWNRLYYIEKTK